MNAAISVAVEPDTRVAEDNLSGVVVVTPGTSRASADVALELKERRARGVELADRLQNVTSELSELRAKRARALVERTSGPAAKEVAALIEEEAALGNALELLAGDVARLEEEHAVALLDEATIAETVAIEAASSALNLVEEAVREAARQVLPLADAFDSAMRVARRAEHEHERLARRRDPTIGDVRPERIARVLRRRTSLVELVEHVRRWVRDK